MAVAIVGLAVAAPAGAAPMAPFGHPCAAENGVRFCPTVGSAARIPSFDGIPLDVDVTLPETGNGPFPTIVMLHGFGGNKTNFEATSPGGPAPDEAGNGSTIYRYNNNFYAHRGYAVVNYTARGFGNSCGGGATGDHAGACGLGYIRLSDNRYEARDTQYLLGLLADEGIVKPRDIGVTGISYGGGQSMELAFLADKIRKPNGKLAPWRSPDGLKMKIAAAYPRWPWSDLVSALIPNGRFLDTKVSPVEQSLKPFGVPISSYLNGLYLSGVLSGYYCGGAPASTPCTDNQANVTQDKAFIDAGQPLSAEAQTALKGIYQDNGGYPLRFLKGASTPAPLLIQSGWTDELFPPEQALRVYGYLRSEDKKAPVSLQLGDLGHSRGSNKPGLNHYFNNQAARFFAAHLLGAKKQGPAPGSVTAFTQTCPLSTPDGGPFKGKGWRAIHPGAFSFGSGAAQEFTSAGGDIAVAKAFDPVFGTTEACKTIPITAETNVATYSRPVKTGFTMMGLPTISAKIASTGQFGQIDARLWDVSPEGSQLLVNRGVYALTNGQSGEIEFQLHGNGYHFAKGHTVQLELLGRDAPYYQAGNLPFTVRTSDVAVSLPTLQRKPR
jgi:pimeloyl-ACP methyl ester carboxylesterase